MLDESSILKNGSSPQVRGTHWTCEHTKFGSRFIPAGAGNTCSSPRQGALHPVHPRRCGEHWRVVDFNFTLLGSSPQVRGTRDEISSAVAVSRFIPAGAGNTNAATGSLLTISVHPRRCGEHYSGKIAFPGVDGSSPQVRGTQYVIETTPVDSRFIPAGAGNTGCCL